jgi:hypothetical protein
MPKNVPHDPWALDASGVAWHQSHTFLAEPRTFAERLAESDRFRAALAGDGWGVADWIRPAEEPEPSPFPLGRVTVHPGGVLLEAFSQSRLDALRRRASDLGGGALTADETRAFPIDAVLANPAVLLQPLQDRSERALDARAIAETWLRFVWPFLPRRDLGGRTPHRLAGTSSGRAALETVADAVPSELESIPGFPRLPVQSIRAILLPPETSAMPPIEDGRRDRRAPRRS